MPHILLSREAHEALREYNARETGRGLAPGQPHGENFVVWLDEETLDRLAEEAFIGESPSDVILRLTARWQ